MKKKICTSLFCLIIVLPGISAQETISAFKNLAVDVELLSTTGLGLELATPLSPNFVLRGGFSMLPVHYDATFNGVVDQNTIGNIDQVMATNPEIQSILSQKGLPTSAYDISNSINATATLGLVNGKALIDCYPWAKYSFHITAGIYAGSGELLKLKGSMDEAVEVLSVLKDNGYDLFNTPYLIDESKGYQLSGKDIADLRGAIEVNSVKPYLGIGFGRAIPRSRVGVSFEIGAFYHGTPKLTSDNPNVQKLIDNELADVSDVLKNIPVYPVISFKLNIKLF